MHIIQLKNNMNRLKILLLPLLMAFPAIASAQYKTLEFFYIAHDYSTRVEAVCNMLEEKYEAALEFDDICLIFYLADGELPKVFRMNVPGDNRNTYEDFIGELRSKNSHDYSAVYVDLPNIVDIFNEVDFINNQGTLNYASVNINWYVNSTFWDLRYNESLIASSYFILDMAKYRDLVMFDIWNTGNGPINVDRNKPFGNKNLTGNYPFHILPL